MATATHVYTNRIAVAEAFGYDVTQVTSDGFTDEYLEVVGNHTEAHDDARLILEENALLRTRIYWPDKGWQQRARQAMVADYEAMCVSAQ